MRSQVPDFGTPISWCAPTCPVGAGRIGGHWALGASAGEILRGLVVRTVVLAVVATVLGVAPLAALVPAIRVSRTDSAIALRSAR